MRATWPAFLPLLEEEALADANVPYLAWLRAAAGRRVADPAWLLRRYDRLPLPPDDRAEHFDALGLPIAWDLGGSRASRTKMRRPGPPPFFHDAPFLARRDVSLDAELTGRAASTPPSLARARESGSATWCATPRPRAIASSTSSPSRIRPRSWRPGRAGASRCFSSESGPTEGFPCAPPTEASSSRTACPIGYTEGLAFLERLEIGFNMYYTFREGESALALRPDAPEAPPGRARRDVLLGRSLPDRTRELRGDRVGRVLVLPKARFPSDATRGCDGSSRREERGSGRSRVPVLARHAAPPGDAQPDVRGARRAERRLGPVPHPQPRPRREPENGSRVRRRGGEAAPVGREARREGSRTAAVVPLGAGAPGRSGSSRWSWISSPIFRGGNAESAADVAEIVPGQGRALRARLPAAAAAAPAAARGVDPA